MLTAKNMYLRTMSFLTNIKLGNITNLSDARFGAAAGATYIGFCFDPSNENYITPLKAKEIIDWVTGSLVVAEFGNQSLDEIRDISELLDVDVIEVNNQLLPDELMGLGSPIIKKIDVGNFDAGQLQVEIDAYKLVADAFHLFAGAQSKKMDQSQLINICRTEKIIWGLHLDLENVLSVIETYKPFAINVSGGQEERVGIKDFDELNDLLEKIVVQ
jgi:phosphoribosylanthranilate isomerase